MTNGQPISRDHWDLVIHWLLVLGHWAFGGRLCRCGSRYFICGLSSPSLARLDAEHVVAPPGAGRPPGETDPDVAVLLHAGEHVFDGLFSQIVGRHRELAEQRLLLVGAAPLGERL